MSTLLRQYVLKALNTLGVKSFKAQSGLGYTFLCHVGDFAGEAPFYNRDHSRAEIKAMAGWCAGHPKPFVFDVGANLGFIATQLAQAVNAPECQVIAFEPVYQTFVKLTESVAKLGLQSQILPICCVISDCGGVCSIAFNERESLFAQVRQDALNSRAGKSMNWCPTVTLDSIVKGLGCSPALVKIDVEGYEAHVLRGARTLLQGPDAPAIFFELNPIALREVGSTVEAVATEMSAYRHFYLDDFEGQRMPPGKEILDLNSLTWVCNLFAAPRLTPQSEISALFG